MLLFTRPFWDGLRDGSIDLTFRRWDKPRVKPGGRYRCHPIGVLEADAIDRVHVADITEHEARRAGFPSREALLEYMERGEPGSIAPDTEVFRVKLHWGGAGDRVAAALDDRLTDEDVAVIGKRLARLDARAPAPWTAATLDAIARRPQVAAKHLAAELGRQKPDFKADVVKLKKLGLTQSFEVGYELSPRGRAYLAVVAATQPAGNARGRADGKTRAKQRSHGAAKGRSPRR